jgi:hypothetical protein
MYKVIYFKEKDGVVFRHESGLTPVATPHCTSMRDTIIADEAFLEEMFHKGWLFVSMSVNQQGKLTVYTFMKNSIGF